MYLSLIPQLQKVPWKSIVLHPNIHPRHKFTLWLAILRRLATVERLLKFGIHVPPTCAFCDSAMETVDHLFFRCHITSSFWQRLLSWLGFHRAIGEWQDEVQWVCSYAKKKSGSGAIISSVFAMCVAIIWRERNGIRFQKGLFQLDRNIIYNSYVKFDATLPIIEAFTDEEIIALVIGVGEQAQEYGS
ncbi:uncharacterized protein LOC132057979 [Lycium ferocissimum]|uniref:uncharacterized protein LOC132057979 n=1 Tax=Lycium ferocissimum TaxID=112874 RepID=UPI0028154B1F|nr:uncharacterized protein LOC132057979 [Lycium ferocissimum]